MENLIIKEKYIYQKIDYNNNNNNNIFFDIFNEIDEKDYKLESFLQYNNHVLNINNVKILKLIYIKNLDFQYIDYLLRNNIYKSDIFILSNIITNNSIFQIENSIKDVLIKFHGIIKDKKSIIKLDIKSAYYYSNPKIILNILKDDVNNNKIIKTIKKIYDILENKYKISYLYIGLSFSKILFDYFLRYIILLFYSKYINLLKNIQFLVYVDDILIFSDNEELIINITNLFIKHLYKFNLFINRKKIDYVRNIDNDNFIFLKKIFVYNNINNCDKINNFIANNNNTINTKSIIYLNKEKKILFKNKYHKFYIKQERNIIGKKKEIQNPNYFINFNLDDMQNYFNNKELMKKNKNESLIKNNKLRELNLDFTGNINIFFLNFKKYFLNKFNNFYYINN